MMNLHYPPYPYPSTTPVPPPPPPPGDSTLLGMALPVAFGMLGSSIVAAIVPGRDHDLQVAWALVLIDIAGLAPLAFFGFVTGRRRLGFGALASLGPSVILSLVAMILLALLGN